MEEEKRLEEEDLESRGESSVTLTIKSSMVEEVTLAEEDLTKEVEVEEEVEKLSLDATNATSWGIIHLNVHGRKTQDREEPM